MQQLRTSRCLRSAQCLIGIVLMDTCLHIMQLNPYEVRVYGSTSNHARVLHFKTWAPSFLSYVTQGSGTVDVKLFKFYGETFADHTAFLPLAATLAGDSITTSEPYYDPGTNDTATDTTTGDYAITYQPFGSLDYVWSVDGWLVDESASAAIGSTVHQMWVRRNMKDLAPLERTAEVVNGNTTADMTVSTSTNYILNSAGSASVMQQVTLPTDWFMFGVNVTEKTWATSAGYLQFSATQEPLVLEGLASSPPYPALLLGAAPRLLRRLWLSNATLSQAINMTYFKMYLNFDARTNGTNFSLDYEVTFARKDPFQYIEVRGGAQTNYDGVLGVWALNDGRNLTLPLPVVAANSSIVLQSDHLGENWKLYNWTNLDLAEAAPPPPNPPP